jgi:hypothetical protein
MSAKIGFLCCLAAFSTVLADAQLAVTVSSPKAVGQKAIVKLTMKNNLSEKVVSARATAFLLDDQGAMVGLATRWVIGGTKNRPALEPDKETTYNFIVPSPKPFTTTNLTAKVNFSSATFGGGQQLNIQKDITVLQSKNELKK